MTELRQLMLEELRLRTTPHKPSAPIRQRSPISLATSTSRPTNSSKRQHQ
jgi:hypothetical protein